MRNTFCKMLDCLYLLTKEAVLMRWVLHESKNKTIGMVKFCGHAGIFLERSLTVFQNCIVTSNDYLLMEKFVLVIIVVISRKVSQPHVQLWIT